MRRTAIAGLLLLAIAAGGAANVSALTSASPHVTPAEANAFAQEVNLTVGDLPGAELLEPQFPPHGSFSNEANGFLGCNAQARRAARPIGGGVSPTLVYGNTFMASVVLVSTASQAAATLAELDSPGGHRCLVRNVGRSETVEGTRKVTSFAVHARFVPVSGLLGPGAVAVHVLIELPPAEAAGSETKPKPSFAHGDFVVFRAGPAVVLFFSFGEQQFPAAAEGRLLALLHGRAEAHAP